VTWQSIGEDGAISYPLGEDVTGQLMYDAQGNRMSAQLVALNQPRFESDDWRAATPAEMVAAWPRYFGYFGTFSIDTEAAVVIHHIESGWFPNLVGTEQERHYRFGDGELILDAETTWGRVRIVWRRPSGTAR